MTIDDALDHVRALELKRTANHPDRIMQGITDLMLDCGQEVDRICELVQVSLQHNHAAKNTLLDRLTRVRGRLLGDGLSLVDNLKKGLMVE